MRNYPSAAQTEVAYNAEWQESEKPVAIFKTAENVTPATITEFSAIENAVFIALDAYLDEAGYPRFDELHDTVFERDHIGDFRGDRTLDIALTWKEVVTEPFLMNMSTLLEQFPLWRIRLCAEDSIDNILVYPDAISVGDDSNVADVPQRLAQWHREYGKKLDAKRGPQIRQFVWVKSRTAQMVADATGDHPWSIGGVFDNYQGDREELAIWLLYKGPNSYKVIVEKPEQTALADRYPVDSYGVVGHRFDRLRESPYWLQQYVVPRMSIIELGIRERATGHYWVRRIRSAEILQDNELQQETGPGRDI